MGFAAVQSGGGGPTAPAEYGYNTSYHNVIYHIIILCLTKTGTHPLLFPHAVVYYIIHLYVKAL